MAKVDVGILETIFAFSDIIGVNPPKTNDVGVWWDEALKEMDEFWLRVFYENGCFNEPGDSTLKEMRCSLESRVHELEMQI